MYACVFVLQTQSFLCLCVSKHSLTINASSVSMCRYVYDVPPYQILTPTLEISEGPFLESTEPHEWKETLAQSSVKVRYSLNFISTPHYDSIVWYKYESLYIHFISAANLNWKSSWAVSKNLWSSQYTIETLLTSACQFYTYSRLNHEISDAIAYWLTEQRICIYFCSAGGRQYKRQVCNYAAWKCLLAGSWLTGWHVSCLYFI
jgi:hypothetical protein